MGTNTKNLAEMYKDVAEKFANKPAFGTRNAQKEFETVTFGELYEMGLNLGTGLIDLGVEAREHVGLLADNRLEWILVDYATLIIGAADVPRGTDVTDGDIQNILSHSDARVVFVENKDVLERVEKNRSHLPNVKHLVMMDKDTQVSGDALHLYDLMEKGKKLRAEGDRRAEERIAGVQPDDLFTLIYTSGTTGAPKGVMLTHANMISQVRNLPIDLNDTDRALSILPVWHIFERVFEMVCISVGTCTYYTNIRNIRDDMASVRPTFMASAPRLWESVYQGILKKVEAGPGVNRALFKAAYFCAKHFKGALRFLGGKELDLTGRNIVVSLALALVNIPRALCFLVPYALLNAVVLKKIRAATGGALRGTISGGGALPIHIDLFFNNIGIPVLEGYGLTETCPVLAVRTFKNLFIGSVGPIWPETEIRLVDINDNKILYPPAYGMKGEIHARGPQVMKGYYKNEEATAKVMKDGWFNTGDLGIMTFNNTLKLVGRSKETIVLQSGENVEPVPIENKLVQSELIDQIMVVGQDQKTLGALIVPSLEKLTAHGKTLEELAQSQEAAKLVKEEVKNLVNAQTGFKAYERVTDIRLLPKAFEPGDELSGKLSVKRHVVAERYQGLIADIYKD